MLPTPLVIHLSLDTLSIKHKSLKQNTSAVNEIKRAIIDSKDCARLVQHQPKDDVIYKPGIDAYGKSVVGPELGREHKIKPPTTIQFSLGFNPLKRGPLLLVLKKHLSVLAE